MSNTSSGKGLAALLGDITQTANEISSGRYSPERALDLQAIIPGRFQPRQVFDDEKLNDLVDSISKNGVLQPIVVRKIDSYMHEIIAGERRYRASLQAGLKKIPAIVVECSDTEALEIGLVENLQRDDLNAMDEAEAYLRLTRDYGKTQEEIARAVSKSRSYVANQIRLTQLPDSIKLLLKEKKISPGHARNLINHPDAETIAEKIIAEGLNVRSIENIRKQGNSKTPKLDETVNEDLLILTQKLEEKLGVQVRLVTNKKGGALTILFQSYDDLDMLIQKLMD